MIFVSRGQSVLFAVGLSLALAFTFGCSSDDEGGGSCNINGGTVKIGSQTWMAENLNCDVAGSVCYNNDPANCKKYGKLYNWSMALSVCPKGWHLPSYDDWEELINYVENKNGCYGCAGIYLKATNDWIEDGNGKDTYGFSALPGGIGNSDGSFQDIGEYGVWWSSTESYEYNAYGRLMYHDYDYSIYDVGDKEIFLNVRCMQD